MSDLWEHSDRVACTHPGWATLRGWGAVSASFLAMFSGREHLQFILTREQAELGADVAWVSCDENILSEGASGTVASVNVFVRSGDVDGGWRMVLHHGSPVAPG